MRKIIAMLACTVAASAALVDHASARPNYQERFRDEGSSVIEGFAASPVLTVGTRTCTREGSARLQRGADRFEYFAERVTRPRSSRTWQRQTVTLVNTAAGKDLKLTDHGDGTLTAITFGTGNTVLYGADGKAIARNPGQSRFQADRPRRDRAIPPTTS